MAMLEATRTPVQRAAYRPAGDGSRGSATLLTGCVMEGLFTETNRATERTLAANDYAIVRTSGQRCCGALHAHAGDLEAARALARRNIAAFEASGADYIVVNAAGCGAMMKEYEHLLADDPAWQHRAAAMSARVRDVSELLAEAGPRPGGALDAHGDVRRALPPAARAARRDAAAARARARCPASRSFRSRVASTAAAARGSTISSSPR